MFYEDPIIKLNGVLRTAPRSANGRYPVPAVALGRKPFIDRDVRAALGADVPVLVSEHHASSPASASAARRWSGEARDQTIELLRELRFPYPLGLLYAAITEFCGFRPNGDEYKVMGLAAYGQPRFVRALESGLAELLPNGAMRLDTERFGFLDGESMCSHSFARSSKDRPARRVTR